VKVTHTYAVLDVPATVYAAVRALLTRAEYTHAFHYGTDGEVIDMHGIALRAIGGASGIRSGDHIEVGSLLSSATKEGRVELVLNGEITQMDLGKAREVVGMLNGAIEAAVTDQMLFQFLTRRVGLDAQAAAQALLDFREIRQGSRTVSHPS
jgi:hypothetical protein